METELHNFIVDLLNRHRILTLATSRHDGWPQATTVAYVNEGLTLYCFVSRLSQKYTNISRDWRVSIAIASDFDDPMQICGLSLAARAEFIDDKPEYERICTLFLKRTPEFISWGHLNPAFSPLVRLTPQIISVIDYSKRFGHSDLVKISAQDLRPKL
jgi:nitroimidazol reductase NimA-like FMN-containing flavoprotein (pyridoxamine 5'-phosphate oxidase superfamily)